MKDSLGWKGKTVRHKDGRTGCITGEYLGFCHVGLTIAVAEAKDSYVQLNTNGPDTGDAGWEWWCHNFSGGGKYLPLGPQS
jgi:hypothetical protein